LYFYNYVRYNNNYHTSILIKNIKILNSKSNSINLLKVEYTFMRQIALINCSFFSSKAIVSESSVRLSTEVGAILIVNSTFINLGRIFFTVKNVTALTIKNLKVWATIFSDKGWNLEISVIEKLLDRRKLREYENGSASSVNRIKNFSDSPPGYLEMPADFGIFDSEFLNFESSYSGSITVSSGGNLLLVNCSLMNLNRSMRGGAIFIDVESAV
jgi:hypothetical protein